MNYKITLIPLERFFFGGENVFGGENGQDERRRSYLVKSNILPQQTTLLGMLREQLLTQNGLLLTPDHTEVQLKQAEAMVGSSGFSPQKGTDPYGLIQALSPVVITDESGQIWQPSPLDDREMHDKEEQLKPLTFTIDSKSGKPVLANLNSKEDMGLLFGTASGEQKLLSDFFQEHDQVGITMTNRLKHRGLPKEERKEAFYRQTFRGNGASTYQGAILEQEAPALANNHSTHRYSFTFWVTMADDMQQFKFLDALVYMGGERSAFQMRVTPETEVPSLKDYLPKVEYRFNHLSTDLPKPYKRIVLLSDTYADWSLIRKHCAFTVTQVTPFRYFTTLLGKTNRFYDFKKDDLTTRQQSGLHTLLQRGSVLYVEGQDAEKVISDHLDGQKAFQNLGYNYFQTI